MVFTGAICEPCILYNDIRPSAPAGPDVDYPKKVYIYIYIYVSNITESGARYRDRSIRTGTRRAIYAVYATISQGGEGAEAGHGARAHDQQGPTEKNASIEVRLTGARVEKNNNQ